MPMSLFRAYTESMTSATCCVVLHESRVWTYEQFSDDVLSMCVSGWLASEQC